MRKILIAFVGIVAIFLLGAGKEGAHVVKGKVMDESGAVVVGASVVERGTSTGTVTDASGNYSLRLSSPKARLIVSAVGYESRTVKVGGKTVVDVVLAASNTDLQEVVVTAYSISEDAAAYSPRVSKALEGKVTGVNIRGYAHQPYHFNREGYSPINENSFHKAKDEPLSTFSIDVDAASYSNMRRFLNGNTLPPAGSVRVEELINYFSYDYEGPKDEHPFSIHTEVAVCPWNKENQLVRIGLQGKRISTDSLPPSNLVFLVDVSGSMNDPLKLPLVQASLRLLVEQLREEDRIAMVVYAGSAGLVLPSTSGASKSRIMAAIDGLQAGGSTAGGEGIKLAYTVAREQFRKGGNNRVILCTDGDFNVGVSSDAELQQLIEKERESGVFLTVLGYGMGNYQDAKMQLLANKGNGNHAYIDGLQEAKKVLVNEFGGTLFTIAKDVKLQVEFNPAVVQGYRLIGYENRMLENEDFKDDKKDAGELGSGHTVTALYEVIPVGVRSSFLKDIDPLKYQSASTRNNSAELLTVKFRYKEPEGRQSKLLEKVVASEVLPFDKASLNLRFAAAVAEFGLLLNNSGFKSNASFNHVYGTAVAALGNDKEGYRKEFAELVKRAAALKGMVIDDERVGQR